MRSLAEEVYPAWVARTESARHARRGADRVRARGAGGRYTLVFADRLVVTLVWLRCGMTHEALAAVYGTSRQTITAIIAEIRPLLAARGLPAPLDPGQRLRTIADVVAYADAHGLTLRMDGTHTQVRRPRAGRKGRSRFVSGKKRQNTVTYTVFSDGHGRPLLVTAARPGRTHDQTAVKADGLENLLDAYPRVRILADAGYRGLAKQYPGQVLVPPNPAKRDATPAERADRETVRHAQSSARICVEHSIRTLKTWVPLRGWTRRRDQFDETLHAIAGLAADNRLGLA